MAFDAGSGKADAPRSLFGGSMTIGSFEVSPDDKAIAFTTLGS
jgi:hypothetical protein